MEKRAEINTKIILLFLEKLEKLTNEEREEILKTIRFINASILLVDENNDIDISETQLG